MYCNYYFYLVKGFFMGKKKASSIVFKGITEDGGFVFDVCLPTGSQNVFHVKLSKYTFGIATIWVDGFLKPYQVAQLACSLLPTSSNVNFSNLLKCYVKYNDLCVSVSPYTWQRFLSHTLTRKMKASPLKLKTVINMETCEINSMEYQPHFLNSFVFMGIDYITKDLVFLNRASGNKIAISLITQNKVVVRSTGSSLEEIAKFALPYSNMYGVNKVFDEKGNLIFSRS